MAEERDLLCPVCEARVSEVHWNEQEGVKVVVCPTGCDMPEGWKAPDSWIDRLRAAQRD